MTRNKCIKTENPPPATNPFMTVPFLPTTVQPVGSTACAAATGATPSKGAVAVGGTNTIASAAPISSAGGTDTITSPSASPSASASTSASASASTSAVPIESNNGNGSRWVIPGIISSYLSEFWKCDDVKPPAPHVGTAVGSNPDEKSDHDTDRAAAQQPHPPQVLMGPTALVEAAYASAVHAARMPQRLVSTTISSKGGNTPSKEANTHSKGANTHSKGAKTFDYIMGTLLVVVLLAFSPLRQLNESRADIDKLVDRVEALSFQVHHLELGKSRMMTAFNGMAGVTPLTNLAPSNKLPKCSRVYTRETSRQWHEAVPCGSVLLPGDYFCSEDCKMHVVLQNDCRLVAYDTRVGQRELWSTKTKTLVGQQCQVAFKCSLILTSTIEGRHRKLHSKHYLEFYGGNANIPPVIVAHTENTRDSPSPSIIPIGTLSGTDLSDLGRYTLDSTSADGKLLAGIPGEYAWEVTMKP